MRKSQRRSPREEEFRKILRRQSILFGLTVAQILLILYAVYVLFNLTRP